MKKEIKVGIIIVLSLVALIWGINFLKGKNFFSHTKSYVVIYDDVSGLMKSNGVFIKGYKVGQVDDIAFSDASLTQLRVVLAIKNDVSIPIGTRARIYNLDLIGNKAVELVFANNKNYYSENDTISGDVEITIAKLLEPYKEQASNLLKSMDSLSKTLIYALDTKTIDNIKESIKGIKDIAKNFNQGSDALNETFIHTRDITSNIAENNKRINDILQNLQQFSSSMNELRLNQTLSKLDSTLEDSRQIIIMLKTGKGTMGQLLTNDTLYTNLDKTAKTLDTLINDLKKNPKRYLHFSVFGKK